jgi:hypothetical protein
MKTRFVLVVMLVLAASSCMTNSKAKLQSQNAFLAGQLQTQQTQQQSASVSVRGEVRNRTIPWTEDLTLARAYLLAEYNGFLAPREIVIIRKGVAYPINLDQLLRGLDDPALEPGDIVDIRR